jgi:hypothetical protein
VQLSCAAQWMPIIIIFSIISEGGQALIFKNKLILFIGTGPDTSIGLTSSVCEEK